MVCIQLFNDTVTFFGLIFPPSDYITWHILSHIPVLSKRKISCYTIHNAGAKGERSITPIHSRPRSYIGVSGQRHAPAEL
jgi:hypothetical protein